MRLGLRIIGMIFSDWDFESDSVISNRIIEIAV